MIKNGLLVLRGGEAEDNWDMLVSVFRLKKELQPVQGGRSGGGEEDDGDGLDLLASSE